MARTKLTQRRETKLPITPRDLRKRDKAPRMTASSFEVAHLQREWNKIRSPNDPDPGQWSFNRDLRVILHKLDACGLCNAWLGHFLNSVTDGDTSLERARHALDTATSVQRDVDNARRERDEAVRSLARVRHELETARDALKQARQDRAAHKDLCTECDVKSLIIRLCDDLRATYHNSPTSKALPQEQDVAAQVEEDSRGSMTRTIARTTGAGQPPPSSQGP